MLSGSDRPHFFHPSSTRWYSHPNSAAISTKAYWSFSRTFPRSHQVQVERPGLIQGALEPSGKRFLSGSGAREGMTSFRTSPFRSSFTRMTRQGISEDEGAEKPPGSWKYTARHAPSWRENLMPLHFLLKLAASCMSATPPPGSSAVIGMVRTQLRGLPGSFLKSVILEGDQTPSQGPRAEEASWVHRTVFSGKAKEVFSSLIFSEGAFFTSSVHS